MLKVSASIDISRPPADVFAYISNLSNMPKWQAEVVRSTVLTPGPTQVGSLFSEHVKLGPLRTVAQCEVTEFVPGQVLSFKASSSAVEYQGRRVVEPVEGGARLTLAGTLQPKGFWRLMEPLMDGELKNGVKKELGTVKALLEERRQPAA